MSTPHFSLLHTTARLPKGWIPAYEAWLKACSDPASVEYVVAVDRKDVAKWPGFEEVKKARPSSSQNLLAFGRQIFTVNEKRTCAVDGWNTAAAHSTGKFLITVADDFRPCLRWDQEIRKLVPDCSREVVLDVNYGPKAQPAGFCFFSLFTRTRYERLGYLFWPEYWGMYGDNDFTEHAIQDGVLLNARHLTFPHLHYLYGLSPNDAVYRWQQRPEAYAIGKQIFERRRRSGFGAISPVDLRSANKKRAAAILEQLFHLADIGQLNDRFMPERAIQERIDELLDVLMPEATPFQIRGEVRK